MIWGNCVLSKHHLDLQEFILNIEKQVFIPSKYLGMNATG